MPDEDTKKDDSKKAGQDPVNSGQTTDKPAAKKKRRRRPRKRSGVPKTPVQRKDDMTVPDLEMAHQEAEEKMNQPREKSEINAEEAIGPAAPSASEPSPFDLAASFDNSGPSEPTPAPKTEPAPKAEPVPGPPVTPSTPEPSPFDVAPKTDSAPAQPAAPVTSSPEPSQPAPATDDFAPSPFESSLPENKDGGAPMPPPEPAKTVSPEPSPFDLAPDESKKKEDAFGNYESPFGGPKDKPSDKPKDEPKSPPQKPEDISLENSPFLNPDGNSPDPEPTPESEPFAPDPEPFASESAEKEEVVEGEVVDSKEEDESLESLGMDGSLTERIHQLLHEANLTTRHLKFCCGVVFIILFVILAGFFLAPKLLSGDFKFFDDKPDSTPDVVVDDDPVPDDPDETPPEEVVVPVGDQVWVDPSIYSGLLLGDPTTSLEGTTCVDSGVLVGSEEDAIDYSSKLQVFVADLEALYNLYFVDVETLLDASTNRTETIDEHLKELKEYYNLGVDHYDEIEELQGELAGEFDENEPFKEAAEAQAFIDLKDFDALGAEEQLVLFIGLKQTEVDLKARYYVLENVKTTYENYLTSMFKRIKDIELNREALIANVQVVDVEGSDLDLILTEFNLEE